MFINQSCQKHRTSKENVFHNHMKKRIVNQRDQCKLIMSMTVGFLIEHTCAYAQWALMHRFASVCLSVRPSVCGLTKIQTRN